ncbi:uncharacterized protein L3040_003993 [Drepanopeziza brunnea f. sp. 'multigermtubi']|nr:hypothetical protein L3040_003993 [Drepanopeziza brunnea f. sp. 'multigermtubi']
MNDISLYRCRAAAENLQFLVGNLPDPGQELFIQLDRSKSLQELETFPKLPVELRLMIWRLSFPPSRLVRLHPTFNSSQDPLPVALRVNQESRREGLRHYYMVQRPPDARFSKYAYFYPRQVCINPKIDSVYISFLHLVVYPEEASDFIRALVCSNIACFRLLQDLELRDVYLILSNPVSLKSATAMVEMNDKRTGTLLLFPGLKRICFTSGESFIAVSDAVQTMVVPRLERYRWMFSDRKIPAFLARRWVPLRPGSF